MMQLLAARPVLHVAAADEQERADQMAHSEHTDSEPSQLPTVCS